MWPSLGFPFSAALQRYRNDHAHLARLRRNDEVTLAREDAGHQEVRFRRARGWAHRGESHKVACVDGDGAAAVTHLREATIHDSENDDTDVIAAA